MSVLKLAVTTSLIYSVRSAVLPQANEHKNCIKWPHGEAPNTIALLDKDQVYLGPSTPSVNASYTDVMNPACRNLQGFDHKAVWCDKQIDGDEGHLYESCYQGARPTHKAFKIGHIQCEWVRREENGKTHYLDCHVFDENQNPIAPPRFSREHDKHMEVDGGLKRSRIEEELHTDESHAVDDVGCYLPIGISEQDVQGRCCKTSEGSTTIICFEAHASHHDKDSNRLETRTDEKDDDTTHHTDPRSTHSHLTPDKPEESSISQL